MIGKRYLASTDDEKGARQVAHEFAADILPLFGGQSLFGTHIYYVHQDRFRGHKEIWVMDPDGQNQRQITHFNSHFHRAVRFRRTARKIAFTSYVQRQSCYICVFGGSGPGFAVL